MKYIASILILGLALAFFSCEKDSVIIETSVPIVANQSVSGTAFYDINGDGKGEVPMSTSCVYLGDSLTLSEFRDSTFNDSVFLKTIVDENGIYIFEGVIPAENQAILILPDAPYENLIGVDNIEDGDLNETLDNELIQISIEVDESDDGNDFIAFKTPVVEPNISISGYVLEDTDGDLNGDMPSFDHIMVLFERDSGGLGGDPVKSTHSDINGYYEFGDIPNGEYVIQHTGTPAYPHTCLSNMDQSQEAGEPDADVNCSFIPVNLNDTVTEDHDNVFVIRKNSENISISGYVLEDIDEDLIGDLPLSDHRIELYQRSASGVPMSPNSLPLAEAYSDANGYYEFHNILNGEYVIYHIGTGAYEYTCVSSMDQSQEAGEPNADVECFFIPVNLTDMVTEDNDNVFVIKKAPLNSISGYVLEDTNGDLIGDSPSKDHQIGLQKRNANGEPTNVSGFVSITDENGYYEFINIPNGEYVLQQIGITGYTHICVSNMDQSQEVGEPDAIFDCLIPVNLDDTLTEDNDNVFVVEKPGDLSISGYVLEDVDGDMVGDLPSFNHLIKLYERNANGEPEGDAVATIRSGQSGYYEFRNIPNGQYVLNHIGTVVYPFRCVANMDQSQEAGEPDADVECILIPVNLNDTVTEDNDNVFVIEKT